MGLSHIALFTTIGFSSGILSGLFGVGGGFVLVPLLTLVGIPIHIAIGTSLSTVFFTSMSGSYQHFKYKNIHFRSAIPIIIASILAIQLGVIFNNSISDTYLTISFGVLLITVALYFSYVQWSARKFRKQLETLEKSANKTGRTSEEELKKLQTVVVEKIQLTDEANIQLGTLKAIIIGSFIGFLSGLFGVGGGFIMVPLLIIFAKMPIKLAIGSSLFVIIFTSLFGSIPHYFNGNIDIKILIPLFIAGILGTYLGSFMCKKLSGSLLKGLFNSLLVIAAVFMVSQSI